MAGWLHNLREKPKSVRDRYALAGAVVLTSIIGLIWLTTVPSQYGALFGKHTPAEEQTVTEGMFKQYLNSFKGQFGAVSDSIQALLGSATTTPATTTPLPTPSATTAPVIILPNLASSTPPRLGKPILIATTTASSTATERP